MQDTATVPATEIKVPVRVKEVWEAAAAKQGVSLIDFLIAAGNDAIDKTSLKNGCSEMLSQQQKKQTMSAQDAYKWVSNKYRETLQRLADE